MWVAKTPSALRSKRNLALENAALRHQLMVLQRQPGRPRIQDRDRLFWITQLRLWPDWRWKSRTNGGRPRINREVRELIRPMWRSNPTWGKPRIQAELRKIGIEVSDSPVWRYRPPRDSPPSQSWRAFLDNHVREIVAIDFFVVPTATFSVLYVFLAMSHPKGSLPLAPAPTYSDPIVMPNHEDRRYTDQEFALILRKAGELSKSRPGRSPRSGELTLSEMQDIALEAGIDPELVARAATLLSTQGTSLAAKIFGGPSSYRVVQSVPGEIPTEELGRIVETIREVLHKQGTAEEVLGGLEWKTGAEIPNVSVHVSARDNETRLEVGVDRGGAVFLSYFFTALPVVILTGAVGGALGVDSVAGVLAVIGAGLGAFGGIGRAIFSRGTRKWNEKLPRLMSALSDTVAEVVSQEDPELIPPSASPEDPSGQP